MAHNFSNLGKIHSCLNFIAWYYWIIKHNYFLKLEWGFPAASPALPSRLHRQRRREGQPVFCLGPGPRCSFSSRLYNWPLQTEVNFPLWVSYQSSMSPGGWGVELEEKLLPGAAWSPPMAGREATWGEFKEQGLWKPQSGFELSCLLATFSGSPLQASVCSSVERGYTTLSAMVKETIGLKSLLSKQPLSC